VFEDPALQVEGVRFGEDVLEEVLGLFQLIVGKVDLGLEQGCVTPIRIQRADQIELGEGVVGASIIKKPAGVDDAIIDPPSVKTGSSIAPGRWRPELCAPTSRIERSGLGARVFGGDGQGDPSGCVVRVFVAERSELVCGILLALDQVDLVRQQYGGGCPTGASRSLSALGQVPVDELSPPTVDFLSLRFLELADAGTIQRRREIESGCGVNRRGGGDPGESDQQPCRYQDAKARGASRQTVPAIRWITLSQRTAGRGNSW